MKKSKYEPLPQFRDSDSDIDIFNAKPQTGIRRNKRVNRMTWICLSILILIAATTAIFIVLSFRSYKHVVLNPYFDSVVQTECGLVSGSKEVSIIKGAVITTRVFKGIPYAIPPIGDLRWRAPVRLSHSKKNCWKGLLNASKSGNKCVQGEDEGSEDCLYLNVHSPAVSDNSKLPVFVWIYGGYLMSGQAEEYGYSPDSDFVASMNVVSVSMNYRLNAFGFLTLEELWQKDESYGNYGFMDQILALKWIQKNIKNFGGDPSSVTICGQSSGGTSIFGLLASPMADGLFHKALPMSGSPKFEKSYVDAAKDNRIFVTRTKCKTYKTSHEIRTCLYNLSANEVYKAIPQTVYPYWSMDDLLDFPTIGLIDGAVAVVNDTVVPKPPKYLSSISFNKSFGKVSVLVGNTAQEIGYEPVHHFNNSWNKFYLFLKNRTDSFSPSVIDLLWGNLYKNKSSKSHLQHSAQFIYETVSTDVRVTCPTNKLVKDFMQSSHHNVYRYIVTHSTDKPVIFSDHTSHNAYHGIDSSALFGFKAELKAGYVLNSNDVKFMNSIRSSFSQFISTGLPGGSSWKPGQTAVFNAEGIIHMLNKDFHEKRCNFWNNENNGFVPYAWIN